MKITEYLIKADVSVHKKFWIVLTTSPLLLWKLGKEILKAVWEISFLKSLLHFAFTWWERIEIWILKNVITNRVYLKNFKSERVTCISRLVCICVLSSKPVCLWCTSASVSTTSTFTFRCQKILYSFIRSEFRTPWKNLTG